MAVHDTRAARRSQQGARRSGPRQRIRPADAVGTVLDERFEIVGPIASGAYGCVVEGRDLQTGERVAIKLFDAPRSMETRFWREVEMMRGVAHPVLVKLLAAGAIEGAAAFDRTQPYFVMEHVEGPTLRAWARTEVLAPLRVLEMLRPIAEALDALHARGIVHRDVKLDNILITRSSPKQVRLIDLGIAFALAECDSRLTLQNFVMASPHYVSPEAARGATPSATMDSYSLAVCAYELMTGVRPFSGTGLDVIMKKATEAPAYMSEVGAQRFTVPLEAAMRTCLHREPLARPRTASGVIDRLEAALAET